MGMSGWTWDPKKGVDVSPATQGTWDAWVAKNPAAKRFRSKGWPHYDRLQLLMPEKAKGSNIFRASTGTGSSGKERASSPDWDEDAMNRDFANRGVDDSNRGEDEGAGGALAGDENEDDEETGGETSAVCP